MASQLQVHLVGGLRSNTEGVGAVSLHTSLLSGIGYIAAQIHPKLTLLLPSTSDPHGSCGTGPGRCWKSLMVTYAHLHPTVPLMKLPIADTCSVMRGTTDGEGRGQLQSQWLQVAKGSKDTSTGRSVLVVDLVLWLKTLQKAHASIQGGKRAGSKE